MWVLDASWKLCFPTSIRDAWNNYPLRVHEVRKTTGFILLIFRVSLVRKLTILVPRTVCMLLPVKAQYTEEDLQPYIDKKIRFWYDSAYKPVYDPKLPDAVKSGQLKEVISPPSWLLGWPDAPKSMPALKPWR